MKAETSISTYLVWLVLLLGVQWSRTECNANETTVLYLLNVQPYPDSRPFAGWDRGFELIPAGRLAIEQINNQSDLLPGYRLELIDIESEACGISVINTGRVNFYRHLVDPNSLVVGVVGLFCSTVTAAISPIANHPGIDYIQVAGSTSPLFQNVAAYPRLFQTISSSIVFNRATLRLMDKFTWRKISSVHDENGVFFTTTADNFASIINANHSLELVTRIPTSLRFISETFTNLRQAGARIVYASLTVPEAANLMCEAYKGGFLWPGYVYIFHERTLQEFLESESACGERELTEALEGVFLHQYRLHAEAGDRLVSGWTYEEYHDEYLQRLTEFANATGMQLQDNSYATVLHDEVWSLALALNRSLETLNISLADYGFGQTTVTNTIAENLDNVSFQGAAGYVKFNSYREAGSSVNIFQVQSGQPVLVGVYNPNSDDLSLNNSRLLSAVPADRFETVYELLPQWLMIIIFSICGLSYILTTVILVLFLYFRNKPEIKATSPYLSLMMFAACYLVYTASVMRTIHRSFVIGTNAFTAVCNVEIWCGSIGFDIIFATLFVKLLRIYHVFGVFRKTSKYWSDQYLFLGVMLICSGGVLILILWTAIDIIHLETSEMYVPNAQPPYYMATTRCSSTNLGIWLAAAFSYTGVIILLVMFLAIQTRHVKLQNFKDTKKVNAYIFTTVIVLAIVLPLWYVFDTRVNSLIGGHIALTVGFLSVGVFCQLLLFAPKTIPLLCKCNKNRVLLRKKESQFAVMSS